MAFPPAHILVGVGAAELVRAVVPLPRWRAWALAAALAVVPDLDFVVGLVRGNAGLHHGTFTHSIAATVSVALLVGIAGGGRWALLAAAGYGSHIVVDLLDARGHTNVILGWPLSREPAMAFGRLFPKVMFEPDDGIWAVFKSLFRPEILEQFASQTLVAFAGFVLLFALAATLRRVLQRA